MSLYPTIFNIQSMQNMQSLDTTTNINQTISTMIYNTYTGLLQTHGWQSTNTQYAQARYIVAKNLYDAGHPYASTLFEQVMQDASTDPECKHMARINLATMLLKTNPEQSYHLFKDISRDNKEDPETRSYAKLQFTIILRNNNDNNKAFKNFSKLLNDPYLSHSNLEVVQYNMAQMYHHGIGINTQLTKAFTLYKELLSSSNFSIIQDIRQLLTDIAPFPEATILYENIIYDIYIPQEIRYYAKLNLACSIIHQDKALNYFTDIIKANTATPIDRTNALLYAALIHHIKGNELSTTYFKEILNIPNIPKYHQLTQAYLQASPTHIITNLYHTMLLDPQYDIRSIGQHCLNIQHTLHSPPNQIIPKSEDSHNIDTIIIVPEPKDSHNTHPTITVPENSVCCTVVTPLESSVVVQEVVREHKALSGARQFILDKGIPDYEQAMRHIAGLVDYIKEKGGELCKRDRSYKCNAHRQHHPHGQCLETPGARKSVFKQITRLLGLAQQLTEPIKVDDVSESSSEPGIQTEICWTLEDNWALACDYLEILEDIEKEVLELYQDVGYAVEYGDVNSDGLDAVFNTVLNDKSLLTGYYELLHYYPKSEQFMIGFKEFKMIGYDEEEIINLELDEEQTTRLIYVARARYEKNGNVALTNFMGTILEYMNLELRPADKQKIITLLDQVHEQEAYIQLKTILKKFQDRALPDLEGRINKLETKIYNAGEHYQKCHSLIQDPLAIGDTEFELAITQMEEYCVSLEKMKYTISELTEKLTRYQQRIGTFNLNGKFLKQEAIRAAVITIAAP